LVIGYEPLILIVPLAGLVAVAAVVHLPFLTGVRNLTLGLTATLAVGLAITTPVQLWHLGACDALALNLVALVGAGAAGLSLLDARGRTWSVATRLVVLATTGAVGLGLYLAADPVCMGGPFARMSREAVDIWLVHVTEMHSAFKMLETNPTPVLVFGIFAAAALVAAVRRYQRLRTVDAAAMLTLLIVAIPLGLTAVKFIPYASFIAAFALALTVSELQGSLNLTPLSARLLGVMAFNQSSLSLLVAPLLLLMGTSKMVVEGNTRSATEACMETPSIRPLAKLPAGFVVANTDLGPFIVALTPHSVLAAPYHRIDGAIIETDRIFKALPDEAEARLRRLNASYVVECFATVADGKQPVLSAGERRESLLGHLTLGVTVPFLEEIVGASPAKNLRVWRVKPKPE
jgi:hypothetical protein